MRDGGRAGTVLSVAAVSVFVSLLGLTLAGRMLRAPPATLAAAVAFLPYVYAVSAVALLAAGAAAPGRRSIWASLGGLVLAAGLLWGPAGRPPPGDGVPVRVMSWNVRRLWGGPDDGGSPRACAARAIEAVEPDVVVLLEVSALDTSALSRELGLACAHHPYRAGGAPKHGGLAACTRGAGWAFRKGGGQRFVDDEDWFYVLAEVERDGRRVNVLAVHLYPYEYVARKLRTGVEELAQGDPAELVELANAGEDVVKGQSDQSAALLERVEKLRDPTLIAGDFNSTRDAFLHTALRRHLSDAWEVGGKGFGGTVRLFDWLPLRIDYVYASPEFAVGGVRVGEAGCSDHRPVVADLVLRSGPGARPAR